MTDLKWCQEHGTRGLDGSLCEVSVDKCEACRLRAALREIAQPTPSVDMADPETDQLRDALHKINLLRYMAERALSQGNAAESRPLSPSSSTPPAPPAHSKYEWRRCSRCGGQGHHYCLDAGTAAQRPPDPAAPDLRGLLRDVLPIAERAWHADLNRRNRAAAALGEPDVADLPEALQVAREGALLSRIRAALDDSGKVGATPRPPEGT